MYRTVLALLVVCAAAGAARADVATQSLSYDWSNDQPQPTFSFNPFDTLNGTRQLTAVRLGFEGTITLEGTAQTWGEEPVAAGDWSAEATHLVMAYFNGGESGGLELLQGIGGLALQDITGDLAPGAPGEAFVFTAEPLALDSTVEIDSAYFPDFSAGQPLNGFMDGWFEGLVTTPPANGQWIDLLGGTLSQEGTVTLTYEFTAVPEPASALAALGGLLALSLRRRRR